MNDIKPGLDISALSSLSKTQLIQMITGITPVGDGSQEGIGFVIVQEGDSVNETGQPDVGTYPRYARYPWIDTESKTSPVLKVWAGTYDGNNVPSNNYSDWVVATIGDASISTAKIQDAAITLAKLTASNSTNGNKLLYTSADGLTVSATDLNTLLGLISTKLPLTSLSRDGGSAGYLLGINTSASGYTFYDPATLLANSISAGTLGLSKLTYGSAVTKQHLVSKISAPATGEAMWETYDPANTINTGTSKITSAGLDTAGLSAGDVLQFNGTNWVPLNLSSSLSIVTATAVTSLSAGPAMTLVSGIASQPKMFGIKIKVVTANGDYALDSLLDPNKIKAAYGNTTSTTWQTFFTPALSSYTIPYGPPEVYIKKNGGTYDMRLNVIHTLTTWQNMLGIIKDATGTSRGVIVLATGSALPAGSPTFDTVAPTGWIYVELIPWYIL